MEGKIPIGGGYTSSAEIPAIRGSEYERLPVRIKISLTEEIDALLTGAHEAPAPAPKDVTPRKIPEGMRVTDFFPRGNMGDEPVFKDKRTVVEYVQAKRAEFSRRPALAEKLAKPALKLFR